MSAGRNAQLQMVKEVVKTLIGRLSAEPYTTELDLVMVEKA